MGATLSLREIARDVASATGPPRQHFPSSRRCSCPRRAGFQRVGQELEAAMACTNAAASRAWRSPRAYQEAHVALSGIGADGGVEALARLTPFDYLALRADDTARRLVNPRLRAFLDEDRRRGRVLTETIRAVADADLNLRVAAERLQVHPNTAQYRLRRVEERTGRNPRRIADLLDLLVAIALDDALAPASWPARLRGAPGAG
jgi:DNA-binding PucR family transcriptional regulator